MGRKSKVLSADSGRNTICYLQVLGLGNDTEDCSPSVLLFFDHQRYLFNAGDGFQRFCVEHGVRMSRLESVMLTRSATAALGGLSGMLLSMVQEGPGGEVGSIMGGASRMAVFGPRGLRNFVSGARSYVGMRNLELELNEIGPGGVGRISLERGRESGPRVPRGAPLVKNALVEITPIMLWVPHPADVSAGGKAAGSPPGSPRGAKRARAASPPAAAPGTEPGAPGPVACYVCKLPPIPGKFHPERAAALKVPRGPSYAALVRGQSVTLEDGTVVKPEDVVDPPSPGPVVLVADCPSEDYLPALQRSPELRAVAAAAAAEDSREPVACIVHLAPGAVVATEAYAAFVASFPEAQHIFAGRGAAAPVEAAPVMLASAAVQARMSALSPEFFPDHSISWGRAAGGDPEVATTHVGTLPAGAPAGAVAGRNLLKFHLRPAAKRGLEAPPEVPDRFASAAAVRQGVAPEVVSAAHAGLKAAQGLSLPGSLGELGRENLEVTFLGTGAAVPSKYRNVTGIYLDRFSRGGLLLDAGEGTYGQLVRRFGSASARERVADLGLVWISHMHADHHLGLPRILAARREALQARCAPGERPEPLTVVGPRPLRRTLGELSQLEDLCYRFVDHCLVPENVDVAQLPPGAFPKWVDRGLEAEKARALLDRAKQRLGLRRLESVEVEHTCRFSYACVLEADEGWIVSFSGDTRPNRAFAEAARGSTVMIHEATFEDGLEQEARAKKHSLVGEAVKVGKLAGAYRTVLTHFSQRYPTIPVFSGEFEESTCIAFDLLSFNLQDLPRLPSLVGPLRMLFGKHDFTEEEGLLEGGKGQGGEG
jgi:ribonuclease Z